VSTSTATAAADNITPAVLAFTHETAPLPVREKLAIAPERVEEFRRKLRALSGVVESVVLGTCNRVEIYIAARQSTLPVLRDAIPALLAAYQSLAAGVLAAHCRWLEGLPAIEHLFRVASGVDSQMVGESEILGQVKDAYAQALTCHATGPVLNRAFQKSFQAAAWTQTRTPIGHGQVSIGNIAVELAMRIFGDLSRSHVLVLGTGEVGRKTAQAFVSRGACSLSVASRTLESARALAQSTGGTAIELPEALRSLGQHDIVIGSATTPGALLNTDAVRSAAAERNGAPLFLIDLGLPRNFPPGSTTIPGVYLYNLDDISGIANENLRTRLAAVEKVKSALHHKATRVWERILVKYAG
jgi:glutamyl-tRNA reductase